MLLAEIFENIKNGNFSKILSCKDFLKKINSAKHMENIFSLCANFIYFSTEAILKSEQLDPLVELVNICCTEGEVKYFAIGRETKLKSLAYILIFGIKKGFSSEQAVTISQKLESALNFDRELCAGNRDMLRKIYASVWNFSLQNGMTSSDAVKLQTFALIFLLLSGESLTKICDICLKVGKFGVDGSCSPTVSAEMYEKLLNCISSFWLKYRMPMERSSVVLLNLIVLQYAKHLLASKKCVNFSRTFKPLASQLENVCDTQITMSFKMSFKIVEAGMALIIQQCNEEMVEKLLKASNVITMADITANTIIVDGILQFLYFFEKKDSDSSAGCELSPTLVKNILQTLSSRMHAKNSLMQDTVMKVLDHFSSRLECFVSKMDNVIMANNLPLVKEALWVAELTTTFLDMTLDYSESVETCIFNIGIHCSNLGVFAYRCEDYGTAAGFFNVGILYLYSCSKLSEKTNSIVVLKKKAVLLKDSLRLSGQYRESGMITVKLALQSLIPVKEIVPSWVKCKRDDRRFGKNELKNVTIKDIYESVLVKYGFSPPLDFQIEDLLLQEFQGLKPFGPDIAEDELACAKALMDSKHPLFQVEGLLRLTETLWLYRENLESVTEESSLNCVSKAFNLLKSSSAKDRFINDILLELTARAYFWLYLCKLQSNQNMAETEIKTVEKEAPSFTAQSTDLGEEVQPNDACNIRPSTSVTTFAMQENTLEDLHKSLCFWEAASKRGTFHLAEEACSTLLSMGYVYKLCGLISSALQAYAVLLSISNKYDLEKYWMQGVTEIMLLVPEIVSKDVVRRLTSLAEREPDTRDQCTVNYFKFEVLADLSYLHFKKGEYVQGAELLQRCLANPLLMEKRTPPATEVQIEIYFAASLYAALPKSFLPPHLRPTEPCLYLALSATRKAIGMILYATELNTAIVCHDYKIAWMHHKTNMWFARLCQLSAQPRQARAYLRQALTLAEKLTLPLRTAEALSLLAEIDLQCEQLDDCRVKIDSLDGLFCMHSDICPKESKTTMHTVNSICSGDVLNKNLKFAVKKKSDWNLINVYQDAEESMREQDISSDYNLTHEAVDLTGHLVVGEEDRINHLTTLGLQPSSPSLFYREENYVVAKLDCPSGIVECSVCSAPEIHCVAIMSSCLMAMIHTHRDNSKGARGCLQQALKQLQEYKDLSSQITSKFKSILAGVRNSELSYCNSCETENGMFLQSSLALVNLQFHLFDQEVFCLEKDFETAYSKSLTVLKEISNWSPLILVQNHSMLLQLILKGYTIEKIVKSEGKHPDPDVESEYLSSFLDQEDSKERTADSTAFKTPARPTGEKYRGKQMVGMKLRRKITSDVPATPQNSTLPFTPTVATPFRIFTDDEDETLVASAVRLLEKNNKTRSCFNKRFKSEMIANDNRVKKLDIPDSNMEDTDTLESSFNQLSVKESSSQFSGILQLPHNDKLANRNKKPVRTYSSLRKTATSITTGNTTVPSDHSNDIVTSPVSNISEGSVQPIPQVNIIELSPLAEEETLPTGKSRKKASERKTVRKVTKAKPVTESAVESLGPSPTGRVTRHSRANQRI